MDFDAAFSLSIDGQKILSSLFSVAAANGKPEKGSEHFLES
jgi:hypothetical protein